MTRTPSSGNARPEGVVGVDPSLRCTALVYLPPFWDPRNPREHLEYESEIGYSLAKDASPAEQVGRLRDIALTVSLFVERHKVSHVYVEGHAFAQSAYQGLKLGELVGAVKVTLLLRNEVVAVPVATQSARKLFLGGPKLPKKAQVLVAQKVRELGFDWETADPADALIVANWGRSELGMEPMVCG